MRLKFRVKNTIYSVAQQRLFSTANVIAPSTAEMVFLYRETNNSIFEMKSLKCLIWSKWGRGF